MLIWNAEEARPMKEGLRQDGAWRESILGPCWHLREAAWSPLYLFPSAFSHLHQPLESLVNFVPAEGRASSEGAGGEVLSRDW